MDFMDKDEGCQVLFFYKALEMRCYQYATIAKKKKL